MSIFLGAAAGVGVTLSFEAFFLGSFVLVVEGELVAAGVVVDVVFAVALGG